MTKIKLKGLNIRQSKGKWYVSIRATGETLVRGFSGDRAALDKHLASAKFLMTYSARTTTKSSFSEGTLGALIDWYKAETVRWASLKPRTQEDYNKCFSWLGAELQYPVELIDKEGIASVRNKAAKKKWPRFADQLVAALSSVFAEAVEVGRAPSNPCLGIKRVHKASHDANREWTADEEQTAFKDAPMQVLTPMLIARETGLRGGTIQSLLWSDYRGGRIYATAEKNEAVLEIPVSARLAAHLNAINKKSVFICTNARGVPWKHKKAMQQAVSKHLLALAKDGAVAPGLTLHGLRATLAAELRTLGLDLRTIADVLGDESEKMGGHYSRHARRIVAVERAFKLRSEGCANNGN
ncbi:MAG: tyrosine-type recombinase/integrase [Pseudomonadota bacterium]